MGNSINCKESKKVKEEEIKNELRINTSKINEFQSSDPDIEIHSSSMSKSNENSNPINKNNQVDDNEKGKDQFESENMRKTRKKKTTIKPEQELVRKTK